MADLAVWQRTIVDEEGNVIPGAEIEVRREEDDSLATLYADRAGETLLANPLAADMSGFVRFFAQGDAYTITAMGAGSTRTWRFDPTGRLQEFDRVSEALVADGAADLLSARANLGTFSTVADVQNSHIPPVLESIRTFGRDAGAPLDLVRGYEVPGAVQSADGQWWEDVGYNTIVARVPTDFDTLQDAFDHYSRLPLRQGATIEVVVESGHALTRGLRLLGGDWSRYSISSEDPTVYLDPNFVGVDGTIIPEGSTDDLFVFLHCPSPVLHLLVDMEGQHGSGLICGYGGWTNVEPNGGVINAGRDGVVCRSSAFYGRATRWDGAQMHCMKLTAGTKFDIANAHLNDGWKSSDGSNLNGALHVSRGSTGYGHELNVNNSGAGGVSVRRSYLAMAGSTVVGSAGRGLDIRGGSVVAANDCTITGSGGGDIRAGTGGGGIGFITGSTYGTTTNNVNKINGAGCLLDDTKPAQDPSTFTVEIDDDSVYTWWPGYLGSTRSYTLLLTTDSFGMQGIVWCRVPNNHSRVIVNGHQDQFNTMGGSGGPLSGTTGPDGTINISPADQGIYFENRTGGTVNLAVTVLGTTEAF